MEDMLIKAAKSLHFSSNIIENAKAIQKDNHLEFLLELFTQELKYTEIKRVNSYIKSAKFDVLKTFEDYSFDDIKFPKSITPHDIIDSNFIDKKDIVPLEGKI